MANPKNAQVVFSPDVKNMDDWARRTRMALGTADALGATYARAHPWLDQIKNQLIRDHKWKVVPCRDQRMLFTLESTSMWSSSSGLPAGPPLTLQLPVHASSFFSPDRRIQWQMVFHSDTFESVRKICQPVADILYILQCLLTGLVTVVFEENVAGEGLYRTTRGLPPAQWVAANADALHRVLGDERFRSLHRACNDTQSSFHLQTLPPR
ncbi:hypothetical protein CYLTODRAFT_401202 [Cylindrobasidium torrendii FP15055 ss-10]|uniref:Uncharacterized protein n=1 Tax=Cylindrobasidium torrendii FP15055 ss-10 TaxID=1314674 RepID=A0A0D7B371_9AGAR|nr:hypothetical protein CYLTODRAFT_401202 [Cylindrobasidium torrendii FP15055 ss-10]